MDDNYTKGKGAEILTSCLIHEMDIGAKNRNLNYWHSMGSVKSYSKCKQF